MAMPGRILLLVATREALLSGIAIAGGRVHSPDRHAHICRRLELPDFVFVAAAAFAGDCIAVVP